MVFREDLREIRWSSFETNSSSFVVVRITVFYSFLFEIFELFSYHQFDNTPEYGVERIIERRYYIRKPRSVPKRDQITSTSDLIETQRKYRQHSSVSNASEHHRSCSQCSSRATPTFVEDFREQSDTLRHEITYLKNEIELLQKSQREFFQKLQNHFDIKTTATNKQQQQQQFSSDRFVNRFRNHCFYLDPPAISPPQSSSTETVSELPVRLTTKSKSRSMSTESQVSSASSIASTIKQPVKPPVIWKYVFLFYDKNDFFCYV